VALVYVAAHLPFLAPSLEDIDSVNFALGIHDFDPARHQPHPPGYPVYIALAKASHAVVRAVWPALDRQAADARALTWWSAVGGGLSILFAAWLIEIVARLARARTGTHATSAVVLMAAVPLFWMSGLRPLSDMPGLAVALAAQAMLFRACLAAQTTGSRRAILALGAGAVVAGISAGMRLQIVWLVGPLLAAAVVAHGRHGFLRGLAVAAAGFALGVVVWLAPLVIAAGGATAYSSALGTIAGADFANVDMLWTNPSPRRLALALVDTFVRPWGAAWLADLLLVVVGAGVLVLAWRERRLLGWLALAFGPYLALHLLFQDTPTTRYALPVVPPMAIAAAWALSAVAPRRAWMAASALAAVCLAVVLPVTRLYAGSPMPASSAVLGASRGLAREGGVVAGHFEFARPLQVSGLEARLESPEFRERLELVRYWANGGHGPVWFVASPARTDLDGVDPFSRRILERSEWRFSRDWFVGGTRPVHGQLVRIDSPPGWVAGEGWHLTREQLIISSRRGAPDATMFVARRAGPAVVFIGGELLPSGGADGTRLGMALDGRELAGVVLTSNQPRFFEELQLPPGSLSGPGPFATLAVSWRPEPAGAPPPTVHLTHFELQPPSRTFWVYSHGWHDREFDPASSREWRWASDRSELRIHSSGRDLRLEIAGEAPIRDLGGAPIVSVDVGGRIVHSIEATGPFRIDVEVPARELDAAGGLLTLTTSRTFVPGGRGGGGDQRRLGVRVFELRVNQVQP
jgi:hypothetical protein